MKSKKGVTKVPFWWAENYRSRTFKRLKRSKLEQCNGFSFKYRGMIGAKKSDSVESSEIFQNFVHHGWPRCLPCSRLSVRPDASESVRPNVEKTRPKQLVLMSKVDYTNFVLFWQKDVRLVEASRQALIKKLPAYYNNLCAIN